MCEKKPPVKVGDKVKETAMYRTSCRDREVRGEVIKIDDEGVATVKDLTDWTYNLHYEWLEPVETELRLLTPKIWFKPYVQKFCQHCGEQL